LFFVMKAIARSLILPPGSSLVLLLIGLLMVWRRWRFGWGVLLAGFVSIWLVSTPAFSDWLSQLAERCPAFDPSKPTDAQAVVILGGGGERLHAPEYQGAMAEPFLLERLALGSYLARRLSLPVLITGAPSEAIAMPETLTRNFQVTPRWIEGHSRDTYENAQLTARILLPQGIKKVILVTTANHEWRAAHEFMDAGFEVTPAPAGVMATRELGFFKFAPSASAIERSHQAVYELVGEPMRRLQSALGVRERFDKHVAEAEPLPPKTPQ
jgi:uncharacterized SAM-binding protein YcdF (DUF218 family)